MRLVAVLFRAFALLQLGNYPAAAAAEDEFLRASTALHSAFFDIYGIAIRGRRACMAGDFVAAQAIAEQMANAADEAGWDNAVPIGMQAELLWASWHLQGHFDHTRVSQYLSKLSNNTIEHYGGHDIYVIPLEGRTLRVALLGLDAAAASNRPGTA